MQTTLDHRLADGRTARVRFTRRSDGDLFIDGEPARLAAHRAALVDLPWTWLRQVHADRVVVVDAVGAAAGEAADAAVTAVTDAVLAVHTADCAPIALVAEGGAVAVAHAGWRGLADGIVAATVTELGALAEGPVRAVVGPLIGPECYEFGADDLALVVDRLGPEVAATTAGGAPALDLPTGVRRALEAAGIERIEFVGGCTACGADAFSHRARGDGGRQAVLAWIEDDS